MRRFVIVALIALAAAGASLFIPDVRTQVRAIVRPEPPPRITPVAITLPRRTATAPPRPTAVAHPTAILARATAPPGHTATALPTWTPSPTVAASPTPGPVVVNGRVYDAYILAASKEHQAYKYSCEFDVAWVILQTYGIDATVDDLITTV